MHDACLKCFEQMWPITVICLCANTKKEHLQWNYMCVRAKLAWLLILFLSVFVRDSSSQDVPYDSTNPQAVEVSISRNLSQDETPTDMFVPATPVTNVGVIAFYSIEEEAIKFNVTWVQPADGVPPKGYSIKVSPLTNIEHCETDHFETHMPKPDETSYIVPHSVRDLKVIPGCIYQIDVVAEPNDANHHPHINFTVPECVEHVCSCRWAKNLPRPKIKVDQLSEETVQIKWAVKQDDTAWMLSNNVTEIFISIGENRMHHSIHDLVFHRSITNEHVNKTQVEKIRMNLIPGMDYLVTAFFENSYRCNGPKNRIHYIAKSLQPTVHWALNVLIPILCFIMFVGFVIAVVWQRRSCWCVRKWFCYHQSFSPPRRIYRSGNMDGGRGRSFISVPMEYSNIYIEKEIQDEMDRGKADRYEVCYSRLKFGPEIGKGAFGHVFIATATAIPGIPNMSTVAVKKLKKEASAEEKDEFLIEIDMLKRIGRHSNIVTLLGCCTIKQPYCMLMEYVPCGDLLRYLHALRQKYERMPFMFPDNDPLHRSVSPSPRVDQQKLSDCSYIIPDTTTTGRPSVTETEYTMLSSEGVPLTPNSPRTPTLECVLDAKELQSFAIQIARGMQHLETKQIIHRDLAARNILIDKNRILKISDFGFSRTGIYVNTKNKKVPLRWLAIEAIRDNLYTSKSDVWAYGILLWEIGTLGGFPYPTIENSSILPYLLDGKRLEKPENCTNELYSLMSMCWSHYEDDRPSFSQIIQYIQSISNNKRVYVDFNQLNPSYLFPPIEEQVISKMCSLESVKTIEIVLPDKAKFQINKM